MNRHSKLPVARAMSHLLYWEPKKAAFRRLLGDLRQVVDDNGTAN